MGAMRFVYVQYASDPMIFFSTDLLPEARGLPTARVRTFPRAEVVSDRRLPPGWRWTSRMATSVPIGYAAQLRLADYIDAWRSVTAPENWTDADTRD